LDGVEIGGFIRWLQLSHDHVRHVLRSTVYLLQFSEPTCADLRTINIYSWIWLHRREKSVHFAHWMTQLKLLMFFSTWRLSLLFLRSCMWARRFFRGMPAGRFFRRVSFVHAASYSNTSRSIGTLLRIPESIVLRISWNVFGHLHREESDDVEIGGFIRCVHVTHRLHACQLQLSSDFFLLRL